MAADAKFNTCCLFLLQVLQKWQLWTQNSELELWFVGSHWVGSSLRLVDSPVL